MPPWPVKVTIAVAIGCLAYGLDRLLSDDGASVLTAVIVGATIASCWFTYDLAEGPKRNGRNGHLFRPLRTNDCLSVCSSRLIRTSTRRVAATLGMLTCRLR